MSDWRAKVERARWWAIQNQPFYGALSMRLLDVEAPPDMETAATDGRSILWNPDFVDSLTDRELRFCLLHETLHCAHQHFWRLPSTAQGNIAGDHAINLILLDLAASGADIAMPDGGLADRQYAGLSEEEIIARLPPQLDGYSDACGGIVPPEGRDCGESLKSNWTEAVLQAEMVAKAARGTVPADMQRIAAAAKIGRIDWRQETADFIRSAIAERNDWSRSSRRNATASCISPRKYKSDIGIIAIVRDTSGSVSDAMLGMFNAVIEAVIADCGCVAIVLDCDARVNASYRIGRGDEIPMHAVGGGGTDFRPAFERISSYDEPVAGVVYLTDLAGQFPESCEIPTLWACTGNAHSVPFGRVVEIDT